MQKKVLTGLPVVANDKVVGIITQKDVLESEALLPTLESHKGGLGHRRKFQQL